MYEAAKQQAHDRANKSGKPMIIYRTTEKRLHDRKPMAYYYVRSLEEGKPQGIEYEEIVLPSRINPVIAPQHFEEGKESTS